LISAELEARRMRVGEVVSPPWRFHSVLSYDIIQPMSSHHSLVVIQGLHKIIYYSKTG